MFFYNLKTTNQKKRRKPPTSKITFHVGSILVRPARIDPPIVEIMPAYSAIPWAYIIPATSCPVLDEAPHKGQSVSTLSNRPIQSADCVKVGVAAVDIGVVVNAIKYFGLFFQPAGFVGMSIPPRYRVFDRLFDDDEQFLIFFPIHLAPRSGRFFPRQEYFGRYGQYLYGVGTFFKGWLSPPPVSAPPSGNEST